MQACQLDHITVTAPSLKAGIEWVETTLGVRMQPGGDHPRMGTHNALLRLGDSVYLEVIAINNAGSSPGRPRWFGLDQIAPDAMPRLAAWIARTDDIHAAAAACTEALGEIELMSRGSLDWLITIPADGSLPMDGVAPILIEWHTKPHPAHLLTNRDCSLLRFDGFHPQSERVQKALISLGLQNALVVNPLPHGEIPYLVAQIETPLGVRTLGGRHRVQGEA
jgi:Glyoxalase-like domain